MRVGAHDTSSTLQFTAAVLSAFNKYRGSYQLEDRINRGMALYRVAPRTCSQTKASATAEHVYDTATAVLVLRNSELLQTSRTTGGLHPRQAGGDGSWVEALSRRQWRSKRCTRQRWTRTSRSKPLTSCSSRGRSRAFRRISLSTRISGTWARQHCRMQWWLCYKDRVIGRTE